MEDERRNGKKEQSDTNVAEPKKDVMSSLSSQYSPGPSLLSPAVSPLVRQSHRDSGYLTDMTDSPASVTGGTGHFFPQNSVSESGCCAVSHSASCSKGGHCSAEGSSQTPSRKNSQEEFEDSLGGDQETGVLLQSGEAASYAVFRLDANTPTIDEEPSGGDDENNDGQAMTPPPTEPIAIPSSPSSAPCSGRFTTTVRYSPDCGTMLGRTPPRSLRHPYSTGSFPDYISTSTPLRHPQPTQSHYRNQNAINVLSGEGDDEVFRVENRRHSSTGCDVVDGGENECVDNDELMRGRADSHPVRGTTPRPRPLQGQSANHYPSHPSRAMSVPNFGLHQRHLVADAEIQDMARELRRSADEFDLSYSGEHNQRTNREPTIHEEGPASYPQQNNRQNGLLSRIWGFFNNDNERADRTTPRTVRASPPRSPKSSKQDGK